VTQPEARELVSFLVNCSRVSLDNFLIIQQSRASNSERDLRDSIHNLVEKTAFIELAHILRDHGEEIVGATPGRGAPELSTSPIEIPSNWWKWIYRRRDLTNNEKLVAMVIKGNSVNGECTSFLSQLAADCSISKATVKRMIKSLRSKGFLHISRRGPRSLIIRAHYEPSFSEKEGSYRARTAQGEPKEGSPGATLSEDLELLPRNGGHTSGKARAVTPNAARPEVSDRELKKLQLEAEILGRTERLQKKALTSEEWKIGRGPQATREPNAAGMRHINAVRARPHNNLPPIYTEEQIRQAEAAERISSPVKAEKIQKRELAKKAGAP
jgi:hypothetical protein